MSFVELNDVGVSYDHQNYILKKLSLSIEQGELVSLLGPSGCGKTTTLRVIAGLIQPNEGNFVLDGKDITSIPVHKRQFGMVFQSYALFPHLSIYDNIAFGLNLQKMDKKKIQEKVEEVIQICGLEGLSHRFPKQLSGGQRQRVALARALVIQPQLLLLDEPLSNLDAKLRLAMRIEIKRIQQSLGITTIFVTHDQEECFSISDKVAIMNKGIIEQFDTPETIYRNPSSKFVAEFIGFENFIPAKYSEKGFSFNDNFFFEANFLNQHIIKEQEVTLTIRPEDILIHKDKISTKNLLSGKITVRTFLGKQYQYEVDTLCGKLLVTSLDTVKYDIGDHIYLEMPTSKLIVLIK